MCNVHYKNTLEFRPKISEEAWFLAKIKVFRGSISLECICQEFLMSRLHKLLSTLFHVEFRGKRSSESIYDRWKN